jgi:hypothetical protein
MRSLVQRGQKSLPGFTDVQAESLSHGQNQEVIYADLHYKL